MSGRTMSRIGTATRTRVLGLVFIALLASLIALSIAVYNKVFTPAVRVVLHADHTGMQLNTGADVKLRGVLVGEVRSISADGERATMGLALQPDAARRIPDNVTARLLPKTLFGEKYVELVPPAQASARPIGDGKVIEQDRTQDAVELERVLEDILPLLRAIKPDKLAATLSAVATALDGRGDQVGRTVVTLDRYLKRLNPELPTLQEDMQRLADVLTIYNGALPDLLTVLRNLTVSANTVAEQEANLSSFLVNTTEFADSTRIFVDRHQGRIIQIGQVSRPLLALLAEYSPEYPCLFAGLVKYQPQLSDAFGTGRLHITLEITRDNGKFSKGDEPVYGDKRGPSCHGLPNPAIPDPGSQFNDGYDYDNTARGPLGSLPTVPVAGATAPGGGTQNRPASEVLFDPTMGYAGTAEEQAFMKPLIAAATGQNVTEVPDFAGMMWGPLMRGAVVSTQ